MKSKWIVFASLLQFSFIAKAQQSEWDSVEKIFDKKGNITGNVIRVTFPRTDLNVSVGDTHVMSGLALTSWVAIMKMSNDSMMMNNKCMMMDDLVLQDKEVAAAVSQLVASGLDITAVHNHLVNETPAIKYIHYYGQGDAAKLTEKIKSVFAVTGTPLSAVSPQPSIAVDWSQVLNILGNTGKQNGMLLQYGFPRNEKTTDHGTEMPAAAGMATAINFQMNGDKVAATGDFVFLATEVNEVIKALTANGITVTAVHNHMLFDEPRLFMLHFWGAGDAEKM
jgi:biotin operon repressor